TGNANAVKKLNTIFVLNIGNPTNERLYELALKLERLEKVEYCSLISVEPVRPPGGLAPVTPLFEDLQLYTGFEGVKMDYAHNMGLTGEGINVKDIEFGFHEDHEE